MSGPVLGLTTGGILSPGVGSETSVADGSTCDLAGRPGTLLVLPDPTIHGAEASASSEWGPRVGQPAADADNLGAMAPAVLGEPDDGTSEALELALCRGGAVGDAEWIWRAQQGGVAGEWCGANADLYLWGHHGPVTGSQHGAVVVYSGAYHRVLVLTAQDDGTVLVTYCDANDRPATAADWSSTSFTPTNGLSDSQHALAAVELYDGTLLAVVRRRALGSAASIEEQGDWDLYRSTDGGLTWRLTHELLMQRIGMSFDVERKVVPRIAASGPWVRICVGGSDGSIVTVVSDDGGHSWSEVAQLSVGVAGGVEGNQAQQLNDKHPFDLVALDDATGTFLLAGIPWDDGAAEAGIQIGTWLAQRTGAWGRLDLLGDPIIDLPATVRGVTWLRDPHWLWLWVIAGGSGSPDDRWEVWRAPRDEAQTASSWLRVDQPLHVRGAMRELPCQLHAAWIGDRGALVGYQHDTEGASPWQRALTRPWVLWVGGWSSRPAASEWVLADDVAESVHWLATYGEPFDGSSGSTQSRWTSVLSGGGTHSWTGNAVRYVATTSGDVAKHRLVVGTAEADAPTQWDAPAADEWAWREQRRWVAEVVVATGTTSSHTSAASENAAFRVIMPSAQSAGWAWRLALRIQAATVVLWDESGSAPLATLSTAALNVGEQDLTTRIRLAISPAASPSLPRAVLQARREGGDLWAETAAVTLPSFSASAETQITLEFGETGWAGLAGAGVSWWREVRVFGRRFRVDYARTWTEVDLPGAPTAVRHRGVGAGSTAADPSRYLVSWSGAGGARGDGWTSRLDHDAAAELAVGVDSPRVPWRSVSGATAGAWLQWDACAGGDDDGRRFTHNAAAVFGVECERVGVWYASDADFTSGVSVAATISTRIASDVRIGSRSGRVLALSGGSTLAVNGGLVGRLLRVTAAGGAGAIGSVHRVERDWWDGATRYVALATGGQWPAAVLTAGDTVSVLSGAAMATFDAVTARRYCRLVLGEAGENCWDGRWRVGHAVPGFAVGLGDLLNWSHTDAEAGGREVVRTRGGATHAYQAGEPYRTVTGRLVGDVLGEREALQQLVDVLAGWEERPLALLLAEEHAAGEERHLLLARWMGTASQDNPAWVRRSDGVIRAAGDMQLTFEEVV